MRAQLCVTVTGRTMAELRRKRDEVSHADLVEVRLDGVEDPDVAAALADRVRPVIVTCRPVWEGGRFDGSEEERHRILREAVDLGAEYVDVEWQARFTDLLDARRGRGMVVSMHDFDGVPADLTDRIRAMRGSAAEVVKVAAMAHRLSDCLPLLQAGRSADGPIVVIAMGDAGLSSRVLATRFGSRWTYAGDVAPGQLPADRLREEFSFDRIDERTQVYGVVGRPIMHSLSPVMHNAAFRALDLNAVYLPLAAQDYVDFRSFADALGISGASVTAPFKLDAVVHADECDAISRRIEAANTVRRAHGRWEVCNTDVAGFLAPLQARLELQDMRAVILGAGGAARGVAEALRSAGARVAIAARKRDQAERVAQLVGATTEEWPPRPGSWDVLVNATPVGTTPDVESTPLPDGGFTGSVVYDLVYNPPRTRLMREAEQAGCQTIGGLEMLVAQAELQFEWWTGQRPPADVMRAAAERAPGTGTQTTAGTAGMSSTTQ